MHVYNTIYVHVCVNIVCLTDYLFCLVTLNILYFNKFDLVFELYLYGGK